MKLRYILYILFLFCSSVAFSQNDIASILSEIQKDIKETQIESKSFQQKIEFVNTDGKTKATVVEIDKKGKSTQNEYFFNFRDISKEALRYKIDKDIIKITIPTTGKAEFIEVKKDGQFEKFDNEFDVYVRDPEKAKGIIEKMGKLQNHFADIPPTNAPPTNFDSVKGWLTKNIVGLSSEKLNIEQVIAFSSDNETICTFTTKEATSKGQKATIYKFNLSDLNCENLVVKVKKTEFSLEIPTKGKSKFISVNENGKEENNTSDFELLSNDLDKIKLWRDAFKIIATIASDKNEKKIPNVENLENALKYFNTAYPTSEISKNCDCTLEFKNDKKTEKYSFNFFDLDEYSPVFKVSGSNYQVSIKSKGGQSYISMFENDQLDKFTNSFSVLHSDLEKFRYMDKAVKTIIKECQDIYKLSVPSGKLEERLSWLKVKIPNFKNETTAITQKLDAKDGDPCKLTYKVTINNSGKAKITEYELKPYLLDVYSSMVKIAGKNALVTFNTIDKEKVIATIEDGKPGNFTNTFSIQIDDIQRAKEVYEVFRTFINDCK